MNKTYAHHSPTPKAVEDIKTLREAFSNLHGIIVALTPKSREQAVALTNLETTAMWAIKALIVNDPQSKVEE